MAILDRIREIHDDIVFRRHPDLRRHAPLMLSAAFLIALTTMMATGFLGRTNAVPTFQIGAAEYPTLGARLRLSRIPDRPAPAAEMVRARALEVDANDPKSPMLIDIDPESGAVHASAGTIDIQGTPINIGNWPLD